MTPAVPSTANVPDVDGQFQVLETSNSNLQGDPVALFYVPVHEAIQWPENPKRHDIGAIVKSIEEYGFRDPPTWDTKLQGLVEGNGRTQALKMMQQQKRAMPRGILQHKDGYWCMPILFGVDSDSAMAAQRYAIDHNNLTLAGGEFTLFEISKMWDKDNYLNVLQSMQADGEMPITIDFDDLHILLSGDDMAESEGPLPVTNDNINDSELVVFKIFCKNTSLADDVFESIEQLLEENSGWDSEIVRSSS